MAKDYDEIIINDSGDKVKVVNAGDCQIPLEDIKEMDRESFKAQWPEEECLEKYDEYWSQYEEKPYGYYQIWADIFRYGLEWATEQYGEEVVKKYNEYMQSPELANLSEDARRQYLVNLFEKHVTQN